MLALLTVDRKSMSVIRVARGRPRRGSVDFFDVAAHLDCCHFQVIQHAVDVVRRCSEAGETTSCSDEACCASAHLPPASMIRSSGTPSSRSPRRQRGVGVSSRYYDRAASGASNLRPGASPAVAPRIEAGDPGGRRLTLVSARERHRANRALAGYGIAYLPENLVAAHIETEELNAGAR